MNGYIKLHRQMLNWEWFNDPVTLQVYIYCLLSANYETARWRGTILQPGQFITSIGHMAEDLGLTRQKVKTALNHLKSTHNLTIKSTNKYTLVTVENWETYQSAGEKVTNKVTNKLTNKQPSNKHQITTDKEIKEEKEEKEDFNYNARAKFVQIERETLHFKDGETREYVRGVPQLTEEESNEMLKRCHEQFAPIKARIALEAAQRIKEREAQNEQC